MKYLKALIDPESINDYYKKNYATDKAFFCSLLYTGINDYYLITSNETKRVLRVSLPEIYYLKDKTSLIYEAEWLNYIKEYASVIYPFPLLSEEWVGSIEAVDGIRYCTLFSYAEGKFIRRPQPRKLENFAKNLGLLHKESEHFHSSVEPPKRNKEFLTTENIGYIEDYNNKQGNSISEKLLTKAQNYQHYLNTLGTLPNNDAVWGDAHLGNCVYSTDKVTFLDLDFCGVGMKIFDIASYLWGFLLDKDEEFDKKKECFMKAYESINQLTENEKNAIDIVILLRNIKTIVFQLNFTQRYLGSYARNERFWNDWIETVETMEKKFNLF